MHGAATACNARRWLARVQGGAVAYAAVAARALGVRAHVLTGAAALPVCAPSQAAAPPLPHARRPARLPAHTGPCVLHACVRSGRAWRGPGRARGPQRAPGARAFDPHLRPRVRCGRCGKAAMPPCCAPVCGSLAPCCMPVCGVLARRAPIPAACAAAAPAAPARTAPPQTAPLCRHRKRPLLLPQVRASCMSFRTRGSHCTPRSCPGGAGACWAGTMHARGCTWLLAHACVAPPLATWPRARCRRARVVLLGPLTAHDVDAASFQGRGGERVHGGAHACACVCSRLCM